MTPHPATWARLAASLSPQAHQVLAELGEARRDTCDLANLTGRGERSVAATCRHLVRLHLVASQPARPVRVWAITDRGRHVVAARQEAA